MPNSIELFKKNAPELLDKVYKQGAKTAILDSDSKLIKAGANANEIIVPKLSMDGLADYDRNSGYVDGDIQLTNETKKYNYERGRRLKTDAIDNEETGGLILANLSSEFLRTKVIPEVDAVRFAAYSAIENISVEADKSYDSGDNILKGLRDFWSQMDNDEVPEELRYLFIRSDILLMAQSVDSYKSKEILAKFAGVVSVPSTRFYTAIDLKNGKDEDGERIGGYSKAETANDIKFMIIHKPAILQHTKHAKTKIFTPDQDQDGDFWKMLYRIYGLHDHYENKVAGIGVSYAPKV